MGATLQSVRRVRPLLVLLAGPTGSGKSTIAQAVVAALTPGACVVVHLDRYYRDLSHLPPAERAKANFDHPAAIEWPLLREQIGELLAGKTIDAPKYDFTAHVRCADRSTFAPAPVILLEGILALYDDALVAPAGLRVFVDATDEVCLARRVRRDAAERGRSEASVRAQFEATVMPMAREFVRPGKQRADLVLDGCAPLDSSVGALLERIAALRPGG